MAPSDDKDAAVHRSAALIALVTASLTLGSWSAPPASSAPAAPATSVSTESAAATPLPGPHTPADRTLQAPKVTKVAGARISDVDLGNLDLGGGYRSPVRGIVAVPDNPGPRPLVVIAHLRSPACSNDVEAFPCPAGTTERRYDRGMSWLATLLAQRGYAVLVPDLAPVYLPISTEKPYRQDRAVGAAIEQMIAAVRAGGASLGVDTRAVATRSVAMITHSRSGLVADDLTRAWASGTHPITSILAYGPTYTLRRTSSDNRWGAPHPDVPYLAIMGTFDKDTDTDSAEFLAHDIATPRRNPASVLTVEGYGHNYINRSLSSIKLDDRTDCDGTCPTAAQHEALLAKVATGWLGTVTGSARVGLPMRGTDRLPASIFGLPGRFLSVSNAPGRVSLLAGSRAERPVAQQGVTSVVSSLRSPMQPTLPSDRGYCPHQRDDETGTMSSYDMELRRIAWTRSFSVRWNVPAAARNAETLALQITPGADLPRTVAGTSVRLVLRDTSGRAFVVRTNERAPALANRTTAQSNGAYQVGTLRIPLDGVRGWKRPGAPRQLASVQLESDRSRPGLVYLRSLDIVPRAR